MTSVLPFSLYWVLAFLINTSYDGMNFDVTLDLNYNQNFNGYIGMILVDALVDFYTHSGLLKKFYKIKYYEVGLCVLPDG